MTNLARDGSPKTLSLPRNQSSEHIVTDPQGGKFIARGVSKTQSAELISGVHAPRSDSGAPKHLTGEGNLPVHPGMTDKQRAAHDPTDGARVLANAIQSGSTRLSGQK